MFCLFADGLQVVVGYAQIESETAYMGEEVAMALRPTSYVLGVSVADQSGNNTRQS